MQISNVLSRHAKGIIDTVEENNNVVDENGVEQRTNSDNEPQNLKVDNNIKFQQSLQSDHTASSIQHSGKNIRHPLLHAIPDKLAPIVLLKSNQKRFHSKQQDDNLRDYQDVLTTEQATLINDEIPLDFAEAPLAPVLPGDPSGSSLPTTVAFLSTTTMPIPTTMSVSITLTNDMSNRENQEMPSYRKLLYMALNDIKTRIAKDQQLINALADENKRAITEREQLVLRFKNLSNIVLANNRKSESLKNRIEENEDLKNVVVDVERLSLLRPFYRLNGLRRLNDLIDLNIDDKTSTILNQLINSSTLGRESLENVRKRQNLRNILKRS